MRRRQLLLPALLVPVMLISGVLYLGRDRLGNLPFLDHITQVVWHGRVRLPKEHGLIPVTDGTILPAANISAYLDAIFHKKSAQLQTFQCPSINETRYESLIKAPGPSKPAIRYYFALNLRQNLPILPRLIGSVVEAIQFLGPQFCVLSIVEGHSPDGTGDVLTALRPLLEDSGLTYFFESSLIDPTKTERISSLAALRNLALQPLVEHLDRATKDTTIIFLNDVTACPDDILELVLQRKSLGADMVCAMDWNLDPPRFYDIWISRGMTGDSFIEVPNGDWGSVGELFWNDRETRSRFDAKRPFQVFACWNGAAVFGAQPTLENLRFRSPMEGECKQGEPQLFCKDMWFRGYRKIAVVPSVNLEYSVDMGRKTKEINGFTSDVISQQDPTQDHIDWQPDPPDNVKCIAEWNNQFWLPWNESL